MICINMIESLEGGPPGATWPRALGSVSLTGSSHRPTRRALQKPWRARRISSASKVCRDGTTCSLCDQLRFRLFVLSTLSRMCRLVSERLAHTVDVFASHCLDLQLRPGRRQCEVQVLGGESGLRDIRKQIVL